MHGIILSEHREYDGFNLCLFLLQPCHFYTRIRLWSLRFLLVLCHIPPHCTFHAKKLNDIYERLSNDNRHRPFRLENYDSTIFEESKKYASLVKIEFFSTKFIIIWTNLHSTEIKGSMINFEVCDDKIIKTKLKMHVAALINYLQFFPKGCERIQ